jgi:hypothetical protein
VIESIPRKIWMQTVASVDEPETTACRDDYMVDHDLIPVDECFKQRCIGSGPDVFGDHFLRHAFSSFGGAILSRKRKKLQAHGYDQTRHNDEP